MLETVEPGVSLKRMRRFRIAYVEHPGPAGEIGVAFRRLLHLLHEWRIHPVGPMLSIHYRDPVAGDAAKPWSEAAVPVTDDTRPRGDLRVKELPACDVASMVYDGPPSRYPESLSELRSWMKANGYERSGPIREVFARDLSELPPGILYAEIQIPVRKVHPS